MASLLNVAKGLQAAPLNPAWPQWFQSWMRTHAPNADVRNSVAGTGIVITGDIAAPATISISSEVEQLFHEPYLLAAAPSDTALDQYRVLAVQSGVLTISDGGAEGAMTLGVAANGIGNAQLRQGAAASVIGNAAASVGNVNDIVATTPGQVLQANVGGTLGFADISGNPSAKVGLTAVNGSATTFLRSDSAPPIDQSITPTWTGYHTFSPVSGLITINGVANTDALDINGVSTSGQSFGVVITAGTTSGDYSLIVRNASGSPYLKVRGDGALFFDGVATTTTAPTAGGAGALPATPAGYATFSIAGVSRKIAYY